MMNIVKLAQLFKTYNIFTELRFWVPDIHRTLIFFFIFWSNTSFFLLLWKSTKYITYLRSSGYRTKLLQVYTVSIHQVKRIDGYSVRWVYLEYDHNIISFRTFQVYQSQTSLVKFRSRNKVNWPISFLNGSLTSSYSSVIVVFWYTSTRLVPQEDWIRKTYG